MESQGIGGVKGPEQLVTPTELKNAPKLVEQEKGQFTHFKVASGQANDQKSIFEQYQPEEIDGLVEDLNYTLLNEAMSLEERVVDKPNNLPLSDIMNMSQADKNAGLRDAVKHKNYKIAEQYLKYNASVSAKDGNNISALMLAHTLGDSQMLEWLRKQAKQENQIDEAEYELAVCELVRVMSKKERGDHSGSSGGDDNNQNEIEDITIDEKLKALSNFEATVSHASSEGLHLAIEMALDVSQEVNLSSSAGSDMSSLFSVMPKADIVDVFSSSNDLETLKGSIEKGWVSMNDLGTDGSPLFIKLYQDKGGLDVDTEALFDVCMSDPNFDINAVDNAGNTLLMYAACLNDPSTLDRCLRVEGVKVDELSASGYTALNYASSSGNLDMVKSLFNAGADAELAATGSGYTPLHFAVIQDSLDITEFLVSECNVDVTQVSRYGTPAIYIAAQNGSLDVISYLASLREFPVEKYASKLYQHSYVSENLEIFELIASVVPEDVASRLRESVDLLMMAHRFSIPSVNSSDDRLEGFYNHATYDQMKESLSELYSDYESSGLSLSSKQMENVIGAYNVARDHIFDAPSKIKETIETGDLYVLPTSIQGSFGGHAVSLVFSQGMVAMCNRGAFAQGRNSEGLHDTVYSLEFYEYDPEFFTEDCFRSLQSGDYNKWLSILEQDESLHLGSVEKKAQTAGNCSWTSCKTSLIASMMFEKLEGKIATEGPEYLTELYNDVRDNDYAAFSFKDRVNAYRDYKDGAYANTEMVAISGLKLINLAYQRYDKGTIAEMVDSGEIPALDDVIGAFVDHPEYDRDWVFSNLTNEELIDRVRGPLNF